MTTDEAYEHALKVKNADPDSFFAERLRKCTVVEFFDHAFQLTEDAAAAVCAYFAVRSGMAVVMCEDASAGQRSDGADSRG